MKLGSLKGGRDGRLVVVDRAMGQALEVPEIAPTLWAALDDWAAVAPQLDAVAAQLEAGAAQGAFAFEPEAMAAPLPRAPQFADGSAYLNHVELVRKARGAEMPPSFWQDPLMYQAVCDTSLGACDDIVVADEAYGIDFEAEVTVVLDDVPMGISASDAAGHIQLVMLVNDISLRNLIPKCPSGDFMSRMNRLSGAPS